MRSNWSVGRGAPRSRSPLHGSTPISPIPFSRALLSISRLLGRPFRGGAESAAGGRESARGGESDAASANRPQVEANRVQVAANRLQADMHPTGGHELTALARARGWRHGCVRLAAGEERCRVGPGRQRGRVQLLRQQLMPPPPRVDDDIDDAALFSLAGEPGACAGGSTSGVPGTADFEVVNKTRGSKRRNRKR